MTLGPEKVQERLTRKPPPGRLLQHTPRRQPLQKLFSFSFADGISWNAKSTSSPSDTEEKGEKNAVNPSSVTLNPVALQCRISSMQPFNDTFSPLCPVISFTNPPKSWHWTDIQRMLLVNDTFTSECFLSLWKLFWILCYACPPFHRQKMSVFSAVLLAGVHFFTIRQRLLFSPILLLFPSMLLAKDLWTIPVEAAKELEVPKSVEMPKESVWKSVLVESLKHSIIPTTNIDRALQRKTFWSEESQEDIKSVRMNGVGVMLKRQLCIQPKRGLRTNWHFRKGQLR